LARSLGARFYHRSAGTLLLFLLLNFSIDLFGMGQSFSCSSHLEINANVSRTSTVARPRYRAVNSSEAGLP
jgi:hypothetical protein